MNHLFLILLAVLFLSIPSQAANEAAETKRADCQSAFAAFSGPDERPALPPEPPETETVTSNDVS